MPTLPRQTPASAATVVLGALLAAAAHPAAAHPGHGAALAHLHDAEWLGLVALAALAAAAGIALARWFGGRD